MINQHIKISGIVNDSVVDGPGLRLTVFMQGCYHNCKNCHNPQTHDPNGGKWMAVSEIVSLIDSNPLLDGITFSGGEPFLQAESLLPLANEIKQRKLSIIVYTGYVWKELINDKKMLSLVQMVDLIIDGRFIEEEKSLSLMFTGSKNQRIIEVKKSLQCGQITLASL